MPVRQKSQGSPWLYDKTTGDIVGILNTYKRDNFIAMQHN